MSKSSINDMIGTMMDSIKEVVKVSTVVGNEVNAPDGSIIIPVTKVSCGFGATGVEIPTKSAIKEEYPFGGGSGGGLSIEPMGFMVLKDGNVRIVPMVSEQTTVEKVIDVVLYVQQMLCSPDRERGGAPADHLGSACQGGFEGCRAAVDKRRIGILQDVVGAAEEQIHVLPAGYVLLVVGGAAGRGSRYQEPVSGVLGKRVQGIRHLHGSRHGVGNLSLAGTRQYRYVLPFHRSGVLRIVHRIHQRVAFVDEGDLLRGEVGDFEGEDYEESVHPGFQLAVASLARRPGLGGDVVEYAYAVSMAETGYLHVEAGIVDEHHHVRLPLQDIGFAVLQVAVYLAKAAKHVACAHHRSPLVVAELGSSHGLHHLSAPEAYVRSRVFGQKALHEVAAVQVARGLAGYQVVLHNLYSGCCRGCIPPL